MWIRRSGNLCGSSEALRSLALVLCPFALKSSSVKYLLSGSLTDADRRYILFDTGAVYEVALPSQDPIGGGRWAAADGGYEIAWADGSTVSPAP